MRPLVWIFCILLAFTKESRGTTHCAIHIAQHEKHHNIPEGLLHAISMVESGRKDDMGRMVPWPWTINAGGQGHYFPTKEEAIRATRKLQLQGVSSIDVGCMQVNLYHHPKAFRTLNDAFDPAKNIAYAARFLKGLKNEHMSWHKAVAHYHSANPNHHIPYHKNVMNAWKRGMKGGNILHAAAHVKKNSNNHIRRLSSLKILNTKHSTSTGVIRRVNDAPSSRLQRIDQKPRSWTRKTLKIS